MSLFEDIRPCACGCGEVVSPGKTWVLGHHSRVNHPTKGKKIKSTRRVYSNRPAIHRVLEKVVVDEDGCWLVEGIRLIVGYTRMTISPGVVVGSHRVSYEFFKGEIPEDHDIDHVCHNEDKSCKGGSTCKHRRCVNPKHLEAVTRSVNVSRGRGPDGTRIREASITHCPQGHEYTPENTYTFVIRGKYINRQCRTCSLARAREQRANAKRT